MFIFILAVYIYVYIKKASEVTQSHLTLCDPVDCCLSCSSVHGILQARILEWVACSPPGDLLNPGIESPSPALQVDSLLLSHQGSPNKQVDKAKEEKKKK